MTRTKTPLVSVVIEGFNASQARGSVEETIETLTQQQFPMHRVELVLVGSTKQLDGWQCLGVSTSELCDIKTVDGHGLGYLELKNLGAQHATAEIVAFTDSDVRLRPTWLPSIVEGLESGADVAVGLSLYKSCTDDDSDTSVSQALSSVTLGWIIGKSQDRNTPTPAGICAHNVAFRMSLFRQHEFQAVMGRTAGARFLYHGLRNAGATMVLQPKQRALHSFSWSFFATFQFRNGNPVFRLRRMDAGYPNQWIRYTCVIEPLVTMLWHVLLDILRWFRFGDLLQLSVIRRIAILPMLVWFSRGARTIEMLGMYATVLAPRAMTRWTESM